MIYSFIYVPFSGLNPIIGPLSHFQFLFIYDWVQISLLYHLSHGTILVLEYVKISLFLSFSLQVLCHCCCGVLKLSQLGVYPKFD